MPFPKRGYHEAEPFGTGFRWTGSRPVLLHTHHAGGRDVEAPVGTVAQGIAAGPTWLTRRRSLDSGRGHAGRTSGQMARGPGGVGDPRAHHGRCAGLTLGAA